MASLSAGVRRDCWRPTTLASIRTRCRELHSSLIQAALTHTTASPACRCACRCAINTAVALPHACAANAACQRGTAAFLHGGAHPAQGTYLLPFCAVLCSSPALFHATQLPAWWHEQSAASVCRQAMLGTGSCLPLVRSWTKAASGLKAEQTVVHVASWRARGMRALGFRV